MSYLLPIVDWFVLWTSSSFVWDAEVFYVLAQSFKGESGASVVHSKVDYDMSIRLTMVVLNHRVDSLDSFIAVLNCSGHNLMVLKFEYLFVLLTLGE